MTETTCDYCGLPLPRRSRSLWMPWVPCFRGRSSEDRDETAPAAKACDTPHPQNTEKEYCCFGCRFAAAVTQSRGAEGAANWTLARLGIAIFLSMNVMVFTMALWTQEFYGTAGNAEGFTEVLRGLFRYLCLIFALPVLLLLGRPILENAIDSCRRGVFSTDVLLILGVSAAYLFSTVSVLCDEGPLYFEVGCMVLVLVTLGRWLEATGRLRATSALEALERLFPDQARLVENAAERLVAAASIVPGQRLRVLPGERIPCDAVVERNSALVDEQALTAESQPALKEPGDRVFGGSLNLDGDLTLQVIAPAAGGTLARLIELVRQARHAKGHCERLAERVSAWFLPAVVLIALAATAWHGLREGIDQGILTGLAVLLIACPCALGLATPLAVWIGLGEAAGMQVLFRDGAALERLAAVRALCFDKTGTLTTGAPAVTSFTVSDKYDRDRVLSAAAGLTATSTHCYARAIRHFAETENPLDKTPVVEDARTVPGHGITAREGNQRYYLGSPRFLAQAGLNLSAKLNAAIASAQNSGASVTCLGNETDVCGVFRIREELRPEAVTSIQQLRALGLHVEVLTGDGAARGASLERELGITVYAQLLPEDKVSLLADVRRRYGPVGMVGDGINDAPALAASDVGIALGCGTDVSRETAAVCLLGNNLAHLPEVICLARRTLAIIRRNLLWAFLYNVIGIGLACSGRLNPVLAALAMVLSSFMVVSNSLRLGRVSGQSDPAVGARAQEGDSALCAPRFSLDREAVR